MREEGGVVLGSMLEVLLSVCYWWFQSTHNYEYCYSM